MAFLIGSKSDEKHIAKALEILRQLHIAYEVSVVSCHRHGDKLDEYLDYMLNSQIRVVIAAAGMAAQLPGVIAAKLKGKQIQVIGVALSSPNFCDAHDALLSMTRMPLGVPLVCAGIDEAGAVNAVLFAATTLVQAKLLSLSVLESVYDELRFSKREEIPLMAYDPGSQTPVVE